MAATVPNTFCLPLTPFTTLHRKRNHRLLLHRFNKPPPQFSISSAQQFRPQFISCRRKLNRSVISSAYITGPAFDAIVSENDPKFEESDDSFVAVVQPIEVISWGFLWKLVSRHKLRLLASVCSLVVCTTCTLTMPLLSGRFFEVLIGTRPEPLLELLSKVGLLYALEPIFTIIYVVNMNSIWEKVMSSLRAQIFQRVLIQKVDFFDRYKVGELTALLTSDLALYKRSTVNVFKAHGLVQASIADSVTESFSAIRTVRSFSGEKRQMSEFARQVLKYESSGIKLGTFKSLNESVTRVAVYISLMALYCLGGSKVKAGELSVGIMASFIGYTFTLTFAVQGLVNTFGDLRAALAATERINSVLSDAEIDEALAYSLEKDMKQKKVHDEVLELYLVNGSNEKKQSTKTRYMSTLKFGSSVRNLAETGDICLEDVDFSYPVRPDVEILRGLNLTLKCGTVTALVGPSGAGKSTVVQLLSRFYEPTRGRITVAGEDLRTFDKSQWARVVSIVNQEPVLFSVSVGENIAYALPDEYVSKEDVIKAAKAANAHEFIISMPQGYDTLVGERGGLLSGGQRQRIAIARALLKNAPVLILDEATSALDTVSERLVQEALDHLMKGRTTLVIAHRLSTVQNADQIALCADGKIAELGTHLELLERKGLYASLVDTQRLAFE
ncbi:ABC transporter B family member 28 [Capsicum annuum]|nr:ABC transporter B family member 28 [Capsicum annuum]